MTKISFPSFPPLLQARPTAKQPTRWAQWQQKEQRVHRSWIVWGSLPWWSDRGSPSSPGWAWPSCPRSAGDLSDLSASPCWEYAGFSVFAVPTLMHPAWTPIQSSQRSLFHLGAGKQRWNIFPGKGFISSLTDSTPQFAFAFLTSVPGKYSAEQMSLRPTPPTTRDPAASIPPHHPRGWLQVAIQSVHISKFWCHERLLLSAVEKHKYLYCWGSKVTYSYIRKE